MVGSANGLSITDNVFKNFYNVNANHDDAIQFHRGSDSSTPITDVYVARNVVIDNDHSYPLATGPTRNL